MVALERPGLRDGGDSHDLTDEETRKDQNGGEGQRVTREAASKEGDAPKGPGRGEDKAGRVRMPPRVLSPAV